MQSNADWMCSMLICVLKCVVLVIGIGMGIMSVNLLKADELKYLQNLHPKIFFFYVTLRWP